MVVIASAVTTKNGKALLSRQFVAISKPRIEGLLAAFPKLMSPDKEHTFVETENVRYVYQPLESLYILLITNKTSNILEDLETLHLMAKIVPEFCHTLEENEVMKNAFEIIFAFDEALAMGYKERVTMPQIKHFLSMESHDEIRAKAEQEEKEKRAKLEAEKVRKELERKRMEERKFGISSLAQGLTNTPLGTSSRPTFAEPVVESKPRDSPKEEHRPPSGKGLQLGKGKKQGALAQVLKEENVVEVEDTKKVEAPIPVSHSKVHVDISEKLVLVAENDGGVKNLEVKGELSVTVYDEKSTKIKVHVSQVANESFQLKTHPNMNKNLFTSDNILALKDTTRAYPLSTPTGVLKWRFASKDESVVPLTINAWPSTSGEETTVPIEYEKKAGFDLHDVVIAIPIPGQAPVVGEVVGSCDYDSKKGILFWRIPLIDEGNPTGSMEFVVPVAPKTSFFPIQVSFTAKHTFCAIQVLSVTNSETGDRPVDFSSETLLEVEQYDIE